MNNKAKALAALADVKKEEIRRQRDRIDAWAWAVELDAKNRFAAARERCLKPWHQWNLNAR